MRWLVINNDVSRDGKEGKKMIWDEDEFLFETCLEVNTYHIIIEGVPCKTTVGHRADDHPVCVESVALVLLEIRNQFFLLRVAWTQCPTTGLLCGQELRLWRDSENKITPLNEVEGEDEREIVGSGVGGVGDRNINNKINGLISIKIDKRENNM